MLIQFQANDTDDVKEALVRAGKPTTRKAIGELKNLLENDLRHNAIERLSDLATYVKAA